MLTYAIPNYRLPQTYVEQVVAAYEKMGIKFRLNCNVGEDVTTEQLEKEYDDEMCIRDSCLSLYKQGKPL